MNKGKKIANTIRDYDISHGHTTVECSIDSYVEVAQQIDQLYQAKCEGCADCFISV